MAKKLTLIKSNSYDPYKNLALEEWLLQRVGDDEVIFYLWQNQHTVVIGRNQNAWKECNISTLEADGGHLARRLSGGGAVYHDRGNLNFTFLAKKPNYSVEKQLAVILQALSQLGIEAEKSGRNDILVNGRKISGNAFYEHEGRCYHHGTLLVQVDGEKMTRYLNVSAEKLRGKGVASVKSRVLNLTEVCSALDAETLTNSLVEAFAIIYGGKPEIMSPAEVNALEWQELEAHYRDWDWNFGRRFRFDKSIGTRFSWGRVDIEMQIECGYINDVQIYSDALVPDFIEALMAALLGVRYEREALFSAVRALEPRQEQEDLLTWMKNLEL